MAQMVVNGSHWLGVVSFGCTIVKLFGFNSTPL